MITCIRKTSLTYLLSIVLSFVPFFFLYIRLPLFFFLLLVHFVGPLSPSPFASQHSNITGGGNEPTPPQVIHVYPHTVYISIRMEPLEGGKIGPRPFFSFFLFSRLVFILYTCIVELRIGMAFIILYISPLTYITIHRPCGKVGSGMCSGSGG